MKFPVRSLLCLASTLAVLGLASPAKASPVPPSLISPTAVALATTSDPFVLGPVSSRTSGTITEWVVQGNQANPALLSFIFQIQATGGTAGAPGVEHLSVIDFTNFTSTLSQAILGTPTATPGAVVGTIPSTNGTVSPDGSTVDFDFATHTLITGTNSLLLVVDTNATTFDFNGLMNLIDGTTGSFAAYEPAGTPFVSTPEPASALLLASCFLSVGGFGAIRRWRKDGTA